MLFPTCLVLLLSICCYSQALVYYIEPTEGKPCPNNVSNCLNITTFTALADGNTFTNSSGMVVYFLEGTHVLDQQEMMVFDGLHNAVFEGIGSMEQGFHETVWQSTVAIKCADQTGGVAFTGGSNITFKLITITNCGASIKGLNNHLYPDIVITVPFNVSLAFFGTLDITMDQISVQNGMGINLLAINNGSQLTIKSSSFSNNFAIYNSTSYIICGNVLIIYIDPFDCPRESYSYTGHISSTNISHGLYTSASHPLHLNHRGGLVVFLQQRSFVVNIILDHVLVYNQSGSGIAFLTIQPLLQYTLSVDNSAVSYCRSNWTSHGGLFVAIGVVMGQAQRSLIICNDTNQKSLEEVKYSIMNSNFVQNILSFGIMIYINTNWIKKKHISFVLKKNIIKDNKRGGLFISYNQTELNVLIFKIQSSLITHNFDKAILITQHGSGTSAVSFTNVMVTGTYKYYSEYDELLTHLHGTVVVNSVRGLITLHLYNVNISANTGSGLVAMNTHIIVSNNSHVVFHNNSGTNGGGLVLLSDSLLTLGQNSHIEFTDNKAYKKGGAIYVDINLFLPECFYQFTDYIAFNTAHVNFSGNTAGTAGSVLYGGNVEFCTLNINDSIISSQFTQIFNYSNQTGPSIISSDAKKICFCDHKMKPNCSIKSIVLSLFPGEKLKLSVVAIGQKDGITIGTAWFFLTDNVDYNHFQNTSNKCNNITFFKLQSKENTNITYQISAFPSKLSSIQMTIVVKECLLGFELSHKNVCTCSTIIKKFKDVLSCDFPSGKIIRIVKTFWIGYDCAKNSTFFGKCPFRYCKKSKKLKFSLLTNPDQQCALNRSGTLCGACQTNLSLVLGSNECKLCHDNSYIALALLFAVAGFGLVALLMVLNLTVSTGTINGLIFYANVVQTNANIFSPNIPVPVLSQFISWINLDLGTETCFYNGMTAYVKVGLQFAFPIYIWFVVAVIIVLCRYSSWLSRKLSRNVVQVLATLILLSYATIFHTILLVMKWNTLTYASGDTRLVWFVDGTVGYLQTWQHIILFVVAILFLLLAIPFTLALLLDTIVLKYLTQIQVIQKWRNKFNPLLDAYNGPYKNNCRFWTGLLLLARLFMVLINSTVSNEAVVTVIINTVSLLLLFTLLFGIYQNNIINFLEGISLLSLCFLCPLAGKYREQAYGYKISVGFMMMYFIAVLSYHLFLQLKCTMPKRKNILVVNDGERAPLNPPRDLIPTTSEIFLQREPLIYSGDD